MLVSRILTSAALAAGLFVSATTAHAISYDATTAINPTVAPDGASFSVTPGRSLGTKSQAGFKTLGVTGGASGNEIDIGEWLKITFTSGPQIIESLTLGLLFDGPEYSDPNEKAIILVNGTEYYSLQAVGSTTAKWNGAVNPGVVQNLSPATGSTDAAVWKLINPFGNTAVTSIKLFPSEWVPQSDFGLVGFSTHAVPDSAGTLSLLGLALLTLVVVRRRFFS